MRTTLNLNDDLARRAKKAAADRGTTLTALIEDALREKLTRPAFPRGKRRVLRTFKGDGLPAEERVGARAIGADLARFVRVA